MSFVQLGSDIDGEAAVDLSGYSVSLSDNGEIIAIGAFRNDGNSLDAADDRGHVRVYEYNGSSWIQKGNDIDGGAAGDQSGFSVSLSGNGSVVAIISNYEVRVFEWNVVTNSWQQKGGTHDIQGYNEAGVSLNEDGSFLAIGEPIYNFNYTGRVHVYEYEAGKPEVTVQTDPNFGPIGWRRLGPENNIIGDISGDMCGYSVSLSSNGLIVAVGLRGLNSLNGYAPNGGVRVYEWDGVTNSWQQKGGDINGEAIGDESGWRVSLSGDGSIVAIGAPGNDDNGYKSGHVRVYESDDTQNDPNVGPIGWRKLGDDIDGTYEDQSGFSVSLSNDGTILAVGAPFNDGNGNKSGIARIYEYDDNKSPPWVLREEIDGEAAEDKSGWSVSLSGDGDVVAIGAPNNDNANGDNSGHVRVFTYTIPCLTETCNILTPDGYRNVSSLKSGDIVTTSDNRNVKIEKMFTSRVLASKMSPCVIKAHKYGKNKPMIDTHISENHAYQVGGLWKMPKNEKLCKEWNGKYVNFYHVKLPDYSKDYLVVNGLTTEGWDGLLPSEFHPTKWVKEGNGLVLKKC